MAIKRIRKSVSLQQEVIERGQKVADLLYNGNFSVYITHLINHDYFKLNEHEFNLEEKKELILNEETKDTMDDILNL